MPENASVTHIRGASSPARGEKAPRVIHSRSPNGDPRVPLNARIARTGRDAIDQRADEEARGSRSEMTRRMLAWAATTMPKDWTP